MLERPVGKKEQTGLSGADGHICDYLLNGQNCLVTDLPGSGRVSAAVDVISRMINMAQKVWYIIPSEALSLFHAFHLKSALGEDRVGLMTGFEREDLNRPVILWSLDAFISHMPRMGEMPLPGLLMVNHLDVIAHPEKGGLMEAVLMGTSPKIPLMVLGPPVSNHKEILAYLEGARHRPCRLIAGDIEPDMLVPGFISSDVEIMPLADKKRVSGKVKRLAKETRGVTDIRSPRFIQKLVGQLRHEDLTPALVLMPSAIDCDQAVQSCVQAGQKSGNILTMPGISALLDRHPLLKEHPLLPEVLHKRAAPFHGGHTLPWLRLIEHLISLEFIDIIFASSESASDMGARVNSAVLCPERPHGKSVSHDLWHLERVKNLVGRPPNPGLFAVVHTPDADIVQFKDLMIETPSGMRGRFEPGFRSVLGLLTRGKNLMKPANCSLAGRQSSGERSGSATVSFEEMDAELGELLPQARCASFVPVVHFLLDLRLRLTLRLERLADSRGRGPGAEQEQKILEDIVSCLPCEDCPHFSICCRRGSRKIRFIIEEYDAMLLSGNTDLGCLKLGIQCRQDCLKEFGLSEGNGLTADGRRALNTGLTYPHGFMACHQQGLLDLADADHGLAVCGGFFPEQEPVFRLPSDLAPFYAEIEPVCESLKPVLRETRRRMLYFGSLLPEYSRVHAAAILAWKRGAADEIFSRSGISQGSLADLIQKARNLSEQGNEGWN
jgi:hypothetical protein